MVSAQLEGIPALIQHQIEQKFLHILLLEASPIIILPQSKFQT